jgi:signal transduction histidine kinase
MREPGRYFSESAAKDFAIRDLIQSEAYLGAMFECSRQGFIITDVDLTIVRYNLVAEVYFEKFLNVRLSQETSFLRLQKRFPELSLIRFLKNAAKGSMVSYVEDHKQHEGKSWWDIQILPIYNQQGDQLGISMTLQDITHVKSAENEERIKAVENEKSKDELDHLVFSISQDLLTPVSHVKELIDNARNHTDNHNTAHQLKEIEKNIGQLDAYLRNIFDYTRNNRLEVQNEQVSFQEMLYQVKENISTVSKSKKIKFIERITENCHYYGDPVRIRIILENLISNAILYRDMHKPECIITVNIDVNPQNVKIVIADNGIGIPSMHLPRIYDMYYHAGEKSGGAGLGLFITRESIQKLKGSIRVDSTAGTGTAFEIILPNLFENTNACLQ